MPHLATLPYTHRSTPKSRPIPCTLAVTYDVEPWPGKPWDSCFGWRAVWISNTRIIHPFVEDVTLPTSELNAISQQLRHSFHPPQVEGAIA